MLVFAVYRNMVNFTNPVDYVEHTYPNWYLVRDGDLVIINNGGYRRQPGYCEKHESVIDGKIEGEPIQSYINEGWEIMNILRPVSKVQEGDSAEGFEW